MVNLLLCFFILFKTLSVDSGLNHSELIVWNIGQGQWVTYISGGVCHHFDIGGEQPKTNQLIKSLKSHCFNKFNLAYFSHWDWDHINLAPFAKKSLPNLCIKILPQGQPNDKKKRHLSPLGLCPADTLIPEIVELKFNSPSNAKPNQLSRVFVINDEFLLPGDSPSDIEKKWRPQLSDRNKIRLLVLGHHGSKTSTSPDTLKKLPNLYASIASSNPRRYGHPHRLVLARLRKYRIPIIKTASWNSLHFLRKPPRPRAGLTTKH